MFDESHYRIAQWLLLHLLGLVYLFAIGPFLFQIRGLLGDQGILPVSHFLRHIHQRIGSRAYKVLPTLFWWRCDTQALVTAVWVGVVCSCMLLLGILPALCLLLLYLIYLSVVNAGQDFLSFGWEMFLLEITVNAFFLAIAPSVAIWVSLNLLFFRFYIQAGAVKLQSRDRSWRNMTALAYHYESQPLPNTTAWYVHKLPLWFHKLSCYLMFFCEMVAPFAIFGTQEMRLFFFLCSLGLQLMIWATGNFSYLNHMTVIFSVILLSDGYLSWLDPFVPRQEPAWWPLTVLSMVAGVVLTVLQLMKLYHHFFPRADLSSILNVLSPYHVVNRYGIFAVMTTERYEIVIEGSGDGVEWREYLFKYKPSEIDRRPRRIAPYQPRLDWQVWFLPFTTYHDEYWFQRFMLCLLEGKPEVLKLLRFNPFPKQPPRYLRAQTYLYTFSSIKTKKESGNWWDRVYVGPYSPILSLTREQT